MYIDHIKKRDGRIAPFKKGKITKAIFKSAYKVSDLDIEISDNLVYRVIIKLHETDLDISDKEGMEKLIDEIVEIVDEYEVEDIAIESIKNLVHMLSIADRLADEVINRLEALDIRIPCVSTIQDVIEKTLIENGHAKTAKQIILYRAERDRIRELNTGLMRTYEDITFSDAVDVEVKRENANVDGDSAMGTMLRYGSEGAKKFNLMRLIYNDIVEAHKNGDIHIHDLDFYSLTTTCITEDSRIITRENNRIKVIKAKELDKILKNYDDATVVYLDNLEVYSGGEFVKVKNIVRYRHEYTDACRTKPINKDVNKDVNKAVNKAINKKILRINCETTTLELTDDHRVSIAHIDKTGKYNIIDIEAGELEVGMELVPDGIDTSILDSVCDFDIDNRIVEELTKSFKCECSDVGNCGYAEVLINNLDKIPKDDMNCILGMNFGAMMLDRNTTINKDIIDWIYNASNRFIDGLIKSLKNNSNKKIHFENALEFQRILATRGIVSRIHEVESSDECRWAVFDEVELGRCVKNIEEYYKIKSIEEVGYSGYVYDLETDNNHFSVNGLLVHNCCQIDLEKLFKNGFSTGHGFLREPSEIRSYAALACIAIQSNQNDQHGGQSIPAFDHYLAPGVAKTFVKEVVKLVDILRPDINTDNIKSKLKAYRERNRLIINNEGFIVTESVLMDEGISIEESKRIIESALHYTDKQTYQAMEALVHNLNSMHCLPYSERIWVYDLYNKEFSSRPIGEVAENFQENRYKVISLNKKTGKAEFKFIQAANKKDNNRRLIELKGKSGNKVRVTDNHRVMTIQETYDTGTGIGVRGREITEGLPEDIDYILSPRGIEFPDVRNEIDVSHYGYVRKNSIYKEDTVKITEAFAELMAYFVINGTVLHDDTLNFKYCDETTLDRLRTLMNDSFGKSFKDCPIDYLDCSGNVKLKYIRFKVGNRLARMIKDKFTGRIPTEIVFAGEEISDKFIESYFKYSKIPQEDYYSHSEVDVNVDVNKGIRDTIGLMMMVGRKLAIHNNHIGTTESEHTENIYISKIIEKTEHNSNDEYVYDITVEDNENFLTSEGIYVHNSRAGSQVPFSSLNYGTDVSEEGRMVMKNLLLTTEDGLGNGETPIFPIQIFKLKSGINVNEGDPNYDLFKLACRVSAKRLFPNFSNIDAPYNIKYYVEGRPETEVSYMGCVQGNEVITYKLNGELFVEGIGRAYDRLSGLSEEKEHGVSRYLNTEALNVSNKSSTLNVEIYDTMRTDFVKCRKFIKNPNMDNWKKIKLSNGRSLKATTDHPLPVETKGRTLVSDLELGDKVKITYGQYSEGSINKDTDQAWLLGLLLNSGKDNMNSKNTVVTLDLSKDNVVDKLRTVATKLKYSIEPHNIGDSSWIVKLNSLNSIDNIDINDVFKWKYESRCAFLAGLIDIAGSIKTYRDCSRETSIAKITIENCNHDKELSIQQMLLVQSLGIPCELYANNNRYSIEFWLKEGLTKYIASEQKLNILSKCDYKQIKLDLYDAVEVISIADSNCSECSYDVETESDMFDVSGIISHNCRTRVLANVYDPSKEISTGRGNLSFTSINLPRLAIESGRGGLSKFYRLLDDRLELVKRQLLERLNIQSRKKPKNFPFLMGQGLWLGSDYLGLNDDISEILKHGTLSIGFIGLAETLIGLTGKHHGESKESQELGLNIIKRMRDFCDKSSIEHKMNFTLLATPAEGLAGRFVEIDRNIYGNIPGVTDKEYYTNSFHVPVYYKINVFDKIKIEAPYHELTNAGHITYIELDGDTSKNLKAFETIVKYMHSVGIGYGAINHPVDRDPICGYVGVINNTCPRCGRKEGEPMTLEMWRKIKGYTGNAETIGATGDKHEEADRVPNILKI